MGGCQLRADPGSARAPQEGSRADPGFRVLAWPSSFASCRLATPPRPPRALKVNAASGPESQNRPTLKNLAFWKRPIFQG